MVDDPEEIDCNSWARVVRSGRESIIEGDYKNVTLFLEPPTFYEAESLTLAPPSGNEAPAT